MSIHFQVHGPDGQWVALIKDPTIGAMIVAGLGDGATIRMMNEKTVVWHEGREHQSAAESYDEVHEVVMRRFYEVGKKEREGAPEGAES